MKKIFILVLLMPVFLQAQIFHPVRSKQDFKDTARFSASINYVLPPSDSNPTHVITFDNGILKSADVSSLNVGVMQKVEVSLSAAQIMAGDTVVAIPDPGVGKYVVMHKILSEVHYMGDAYDSDGSVIVGYTGIFPSFTANQSYIIDDTASLLSVTPSLNTPILFFTHVPLPEGGTSTFSAIIYYTIETF